jgi:predicted RNase H-like HicB family nuclease
MYIALVKDYITLTAIFSSRHSGGFYAYIEEIPEVYTTAGTFDKAITHLTSKLQRAVQDTSRLRIAVRYKHIFLKNTHAN